VKILVDSEIAGADLAFSGFGNVTLFEGRRITGADLVDTDVLLVRSVTTVDAQLLERSKVSFVGTSTAGIDHIDSAYLEGEGITFTSAAGCNASAVSEHVVCCLFDYAAEREIAAQDLRVGIIGYGHVGRAVARELATLGISHCVNDPPLGAASRDVRLAELDEILRCDVVTIHVPLSHTGDYPTFELLDKRRISQLPNGMLLINAARGGVVDEVALKERLKGDNHLYAAIDCWQAEPNIDCELAGLAWRATPHIAGHTKEARINATHILQRALETFCTTISPPPHIKAPDMDPLVVVPDASVNDVLRAHSPLDFHTQKMREMRHIGAGRRQFEFDSHRREFGLRRQFSAASVARGAMDEDTVCVLHALGINLL
jgi:erythronate-4-phosphate dehydrogenase